MLNRNFMTIDLELNQPSESIIQIGAVVGNLHTGDILEKLDLYVDCGESVSNYIQKLTGITDEKLESDGIELIDAYNELVRAHAEYNCFRNAIEWGGGDSLHLRHALGLDDDIFLFGRRWIDVKTLYVSYQFAQGNSAQAGLSKAMQKMGLNFCGRKHNALDDALNTFVFYRHLLLRNFAK